MSEWFAFMRLWVITINANHSFFSCCRSLRRSVFFDFSCVPPFFNNGWSCNGFRTFRDFNEFFILISPDLLFGWQGQTRTDIHLLNREAACRWRTCQYGATGNDSNVHRPGLQPGALPVGATVAYFYFDAWKVARTGFTPPIPRPTSGSASLTLAQSDSLE